MALDIELEPIYIQMSTGHLDQPVQKLVDTIQLVLTEQVSNRVLYRPHHSVWFFFLADNIEMTRTHLNATCRWHVAATSANTGGILTICPLTGTNWQSGPISSQRISSQRTIRQLRPVSSVFYHIHYKKGAVQVFPVPLLAIFLLIQPYRLPCLLDRTTLVCSASSALSQGSTSPGSFR